MNHREQPVIKIEQLDRAIEVLEKQQGLYNKGIITERELHNAVVEVMGGPEVLAVIPLFQAADQALAKISSSSIDDWIGRHIKFPE